MEKRNSHTEKEVNKGSEKRNILYSAPDPTRTWLLPMAAKEQE
jgi:hypothetical protein